MNVISFTTEFPPQKRVILSRAGRYTTGAVEGSALKIRRIARTGVPQVRRVFVLALNLGKHEPLPPVSHFHRFECRTAPSTTAVAFPRRLLASVIAILALASLTLAAQSQVIAITGGKLLTISHGTIENGVLVMADGKIAAVG